MKHRVGNTVIDRCIKYPDFYTEMTVKMAMDLRDARAELARMKALSDSQAHALDIFEGKGRL